MSSLPLNSPLALLIQGINTWDIVVIFLYFIGIVLLGLRYSKSKDTQSYFLAGRSMTWPVIGLSMFAASISSSTLIGQAGDSYSTGIAVFNYNLWSVMVMVFFAWFFLPFYIKLGIYTMPEFLERRFSAASRYYFSAITIVVNTFLDAAGALYAAALVMKLIFPEVDLIWLAAAFAVVVAAYTIPGGLSAAIRIDLIQGIILIAGSIILTYVAAAQGGGDYIKNLLLEGDILMKLVRPLDDNSVPWLGMIVGIPILGFFFWGNNQQLVQRCLTAKSVDEGRKGVLLVGFLTLTTLFFIIMPGLMAKELFPGLERPDMVYPTLVIELLPNVLIGLLISALVAALTSSLSGQLNSIATLFTMDFYVRFRPQAKNPELVQIGRVVSVIVLLITVLWAPQIGKQFGSLLKYYQEMLSMMAPPIVSAFVLGVFVRRTNATGAFCGLIGGILLGGSNLAYKLYTGNSFFGDMHFLLTVPIYFAWSALVMTVVSLLTKKPDYEKIKECIWTLDTLKKEFAEQRKQPLLKSFMFWSILLLVGCFVQLIIYW